MMSPDLSRRSLLRAALASAALLGLPLPRRRAALAAAGSPHFLITCFANGGWDVTQVLDPHDPLDATDGIDVDVPGLPPSAVRTTDGFTYVSNAVTRPAVDAFFARWAGRTAIVNGIHTGSTAHEQSRRLVMTGSLDPRRADFALMAAHHNGRDLPVPHVLLSGIGYGGPFAGLSARLSGLGDALSANTITSHTNPNQTQLGVSEVGEAYVAEALEADRLLDEAGMVAGKLEAYRDASVRAGRLAQVRDALPVASRDGGAVGTSLAAAFRAGLTCSASINVKDGFDTHPDNTQQNECWNDFFTFLGPLVDALAREPGVVSPSLLDETTIVCCSEFARTRRLNATGGKDHWPGTSMLLVGKRVRGGTTVGMTDGVLLPVRTNFSTGRPDDSGLVIGVDNMVAGLLTLVGANAEDYLPGVRPFTAMIGA